MVWINMNFFMFLFAIGSFKSLENFKVNFHLVTTSLTDTIFPKKGSILEYLIPNKTNFYFKNIYKYLL